MKKRQFTNHTKFVKIISKSGAKNVPDNLLTEVVLRNAGKSDCR